MLYRGDNMNVGGYQIIDCGGFEVPASGSKELLDSAICDILLNTSKQVFFTNVTINAYECAALAASVQFTSPRLYFILTPIGNFQVTPSDGKVTFTKE